MSAVKTINDLIAAFEAMEVSEDMSTGDKVCMLINIMDTERVAKQLQKEALFASMGLTVPNEIHAFCYAVLKIARPDLFDTEGESQ